MSDGFLGRWSRRKQDVREGKPLVDVPRGPSPQPSPASGRGRQTDEAAAPAAVAEPARQASSPALDEGLAESPPPTLEDTQALTPTSDFKPFMARGVTPDVRNAAVKKLFADPHFNVMDRLDIYIDDYSQPDPLPAALLRQMASAKFLNLVEDEVQAVASATPAAPDPQVHTPNTPTSGDDADTGAAQDVAKSGLIPELPDPPADALRPGIAAGPPEDAHTDLRLQPDDAPQRQSAGPGTA